MKLRKIIQKEKKASIFDLFLWLILSFVTLIFFAIYVFGFNMLTETLQDIETVDTLNISDATNKTFVLVNQAQTPGLHILGWVMIFAMGLSILVTNFLVKAHPAFFIVFIFVTIGAIIVSVYLSNTYEELMTNETFGETLSAFKGGSFIMLHLPLWTAVIGIFGAIFLFAGILRDKGLGGGVY